MCQKAIPTQPQGSDCFWQCLGMTGVQGRACGEGQIPAERGCSPCWSVGHVPTSRGKQVSDYMSLKCQGLQCANAWEKRWQATRTNTSLEITCESPIPFAYVCSAWTGMRKSVGNLPLPLDCSSISHLLVPVKVSMTIVGKCLTSRNPSSTSMALTKIIAH